MIRDSFINGITSNYIRQRLLENAELTLDSAYEIARTSYTAQKNSELYMQQSHQVILTNVAAISTDEQANLSINPDHESLAAVKSKTPKNRSCYFCVGFLHAYHALALPATLFVTIALNEDILLKYANLQRKLQLLVLFISLHSVPLQLLAPRVLDMLQFQS